MKKLFSFFAVIPAMALAVAVSFVGMPAAAGGYVQAVGIQVDSGAFEMGAHVRVDNVSHKVQIGEYGLTRDILHDRSARLEWARDTFGATEELRWNDGYTTTPGPDATYGTADDVTTGPVGGST